MLTLDERLDNVEAGIVNLDTNIKLLATFDELDAVVQQVFDEIKDLENRINAVQNNMYIIRDILNTATRK